MTKLTVIIYWLTESQSCSPPFRLRGRGGFGLAGQKNTIQIQEFNENNNQQIWKTCEQADGSVQIISSSAG